MLKSSVFAIIIIGIIGGCTSKQKKEGFYFTSLSSSQTGIDFENTITESDSLNLFVHEYIYQGGGVGIGDFNNDGLQDVFFSANQQRQRTPNAPSRPFSSTGNGHGGWCCF